MTPDASPIVVDTSVVSLLFNANPSAPYRHYRDRIRGRERVISFYTLEEMWFGAYSRNWGTTRQHELIQHLGLYTVVWPTPELVERTARLRALQRRKGRRISAPDAWIAATALMLGCPLAAHDRDYSDVDGLSLIEARG